MIIAGTCIGIFYEKEVKEFVINEINKNLLVRISVRTINFSVIKQFTHASLKLTDLTILESPKESNKTLLKADELILNFNIIKIINDEFEIEQMIFNNADFNLNVDKKGNPNYYVWKTTTDTTKLTFNLKNIKLNNVNLSYKNHKTQHDIISKNIQASLSGNLTEKQYILKINSKMILSQLSINKTNYVSDKDLKINSILTIDKIKNYCHFKECQLIISKIIFDVSGGISFHSTSPSLNLMISSKITNINELLYLVPKSYKKHIDKFLYDGDVTYSVKISGKISNKTYPFIEIKYDLQNGKLENKDFSLLLTECKIEGSYSNGKHKNFETSEIKINNLSALLNGKPIKANFKILNLNNPNIDIISSGFADINELTKIFKIENIKVTSGELDYNLSFKGNIDKIMNKKSIEQTEIDGEVNLHNFNFGISENSLEFININGRFLINENAVSASDFKGNINENDFVLDGYFKNLHQFIFQDNQQLLICAALKSKKIDLNDLLKFSDDDTSVMFGFPSNLKFDFNIICDELTFFKFTGYKIKGNVKLSDNVFRSNDLSFSAMDGKFSTNVLVDVANNDSISIFIDAKCSRVDIKKLFYQCENFGQTYLNDKHLKGNVNAEIQFLSKWTKNLTADLDKIYVNSDITIEDGELINFTPLLALSSYLKIEDLKHIKFSTIQNHVRIKEQKIFIPEMTINSNALRLITSGVHTFNNDLNYDISLQLSELLSKKFKINFNQNQTEFGPIKEENDDKTTLFIKMTGNGDEPEFAYDNKRVKEKIKQNMKQERQELKDAFKNEFGNLFKKDKPAIDEPQEELEIEWEEDEQ